MNSRKIRFVTLVLALASAAFPCLALDLPADSIREVIVSPDGSRALCSYYDDSIGLIDLASGNLIGLAKGHKDNVYGLDFSPDMTMAASSDTKKTVILWDLATMKKKASIKTGDEAYSLAFSPDGKYLAVVVRGGGEIYEVGDKPKRVGSFPYWSNAEMLDTVNFDFADQRIYRDIAFNADSSQVIASKRFSARLHLRIGEPKADYRATGAYAFPRFLRDSPDTFAMIREPKKNGSKQVSVVSLHAISDGSVIGEPVTIELGEGSLEDEGVSPSGAVAWFQMKGKEEAYRFELFRMNDAASIASIPISEYTNCVCFSGKDSVMWYVDGSTQLLTKVDLSSGSVIGSIKLSGK